MWFYGLIAGILAALGLDKKETAAAPEAPAVSDAIDVPTFDVTAPSFENAQSWQNVFGDLFSDQTESQAPEPVSVDVPYVPSVAVDSDYSEPENPTTNNPIEIAVNTANDIKTGIFGTKYDAQINAAAVQYGIPPKVLYNLLKNESHFREDIISGKVRSPKGALGIAQFLPATAAQELGSVEAALDPNQAIPGAARYLAKLIQQTGSLTNGVAAYNWGIGNFQRKGIAKAPRETRNYVAMITGVSIG